MDSKFTPRSDCNAQRNSRKIQSYLRLYKPQLAYYRLKFITLRLKQRLNKFGFLEGLARKKSAAKNKPTNKKLQTFCNNVAICPTAKAWSRLGLDPKSSSKHNVF